MASQIAARFRDQPAQGVSDVLADRSSLARHLAELRKAGQELVQGIARGRSSVDLADVDERIRELTAQLAADRAALELSYAAVDQQEAALWLVVQSLRRYAVLAERLDDLIEDWVDAVAGSDPAAARALRVEVLTAVRRRRRDLLTQLAVATQGVAALRLIEQDHLEVIWAIRAATTTTVAAMRTALIASQAAASPSGAGGPVGAAAIDDLQDTIAEMQAALDEVERRRQATLDAVQARPSS